MLMLALELSTRHGSVALADAGAGFRFIDEEAWESPQARSEQVFTALLTVLGRQGLSLPQVEVFAVGRGPGGFSGLRIAIAAAQSFALPGGKRVVAVSSGAALAAALRREYPGRPIAVVGDARRETWWSGLFTPEGALAHGWAAAAPEIVKAGWPLDVVVASPDRARLAKHADADPRWLAHECFPRAREVAELTAAALRAGGPGEPVEPLYLHPAL